MNDGITWSAPDGWRHAMRMDYPSDAQSLCGQSRNDGEWAMHFSPPSCPACKLLLEGAE